MLKELLRLLKDEEGQSMVEYGIIIALISVVAIGIISAIGQKVKGAYDTVDKQLGSALGGGGGGDTQPPPGGEVQPPPGGDTQPPGGDTQPTPPPEQPQ